MYVVSENIMAPAEISYNLRMKGDILSKSPSLEDGLLELPKGLILGCEIDEQALERFKV
jgi:L-alanine-DL-glutamate epimerase-like enolase superfamily enzyme